MDPGQPPQHLQQIPPQYRRPPAYATHPCHVNHPIYPHLAPHHHHTPEIHPMHPPISIPYRHIPEQTLPNPATKKRKLNHTHTNSNNDTEIAALKTEIKLLKRAHEAETKVLKMEKEQLVSQLLAAQTELHKMKTTKDDLSQIEQKHVKLQENYDGLMENRNELGSAYHLLKEENEILKKRNNELSQAMEQNKIIIEKLTHCALNGPDADLSCLKFPIIKRENGTKRTEDVQDLKQSLKTTKMFHRNRHRKYADELMIYLEENKNDNEKYSNPITSTKKRLNDITERFKILNHRSEALIGQYGLRATQNIPNNAILGRLTGLECTTEEWERAFLGTNTYEHNMKYLCQFEAGKGKNKLNIIIDPIAANMESFGPLYINDCRKNIGILTAEDQKEINCEWISLEVYGWTWFVVKTTKEIRKGDELLIDYGNHYWQRIELQKTYVRYQKMRRKRTTDEILSSTLDS